MKRNLKLSSDQVRHVAKLARLTLSPKEVEKFQKQLAKIFDYIDLIGEMKTANVEETSGTSGNENVFREDELEISRGLTQKEALSNTPAKDKGFFRIKAIF